MQKLPLGNLPFYWRMTDKPNEPVNVVPDFLPFEFSFREDIQLIVQSYNPYVWECLEVIYKENYNVGYLQEGHDLAVGYGGDFLAFINQAVQTYQPQVHRITEIGCGGGYILKRLKEQGFEVAAIDPSPIAIEKGREFGFEVFPEFYPSDKVKKSDLLIHYDVLEHTLDPVLFLEAHKNDLTSNGIILFAVPDCTPYIEFGDISMILHEHLNYFDHTSLANTVEKAGFEVLTIQKSNYGGVLYCVAKVADNQPPYQDKYGFEKFETFCSKHQMMTQNLHHYLTQLRAQVQQPIAFYAALRALPYLSIFKIFDNIRFFDDNTGIHRQYFDGFAIPVENIQDMKNKPASHVIITSFAFGEKIAQKIRDNIGGNIEIKTLTDFC